MNTFYHGDCKFVMEHDIEPNSVDLIYLDPPFFTGKVQKGSSERTNKWNPAEMEVSYDDSKKFWGESAKVKAMREKAPEWMQHIALQRPDFASYLFYMMERLKLCHKVLNDTGSIYLHCDEKASHYLKMIMDDDELFGYKNFRNEIIWFYNSGARRKLDFGKRHDIIFRYSKTNKYILNSKDKELREPYSPDINIPKSKEKYYNPMGKVISDVWRLPILAQNDKKERVGYPTQKPLALLKRIIKASSNEGDVVLDPFCGCGTAIIASQKLNRQWIGIDISKDAYSISSKRSGELPLDFTHLEYVTRDLEEINALNPNEFEKWVNRFYKATKPMPDKGVDGVTSDGIPIQTKSFLVKYDTVSEFLTNARMHHAVKKPVSKGIIVSQVGFDQSATKRQFEIKTTDNIDIQFITPRQMLNCKNKL